MFFTITSNPADEDVGTIRSKLREFNQQAVQCGPVESLAVFARDDYKAAVGGLIGLTWGNWLQIQLLWVDETLRGKGTGSELLTRAETVARTRGCLFSLVDTFSFQAIKFYQQRGYTIQLILDNCPIDQKRYYLTRKL
ncbi:GNAT family N-acetyltransferase [Kosakonia sacchari]|uniref:GNAT family N-acetyltransferase n=1 Tax=Kosakonia sacchari TaxID=1158459 RepID=UPI002ACEADE4|nr:GNAT family N-acetyltransferase [Kosakonia sacchari]MDZ7320142.1 GNAT family N-acetyltransferase [Kosakonia sacchari]